MSAYEKLVAAGFTELRECWEASGDIDRQLMREVLDAILSATTPCETCWDEREVPDRVAVNGEMAVPLTYKLCPDCSGKPAVPLILQHLVDTDAVGLVDALIEAGRLVQATEEDAVCDIAGRLYFDHEGTQPVYRLVGVEEKP